jgi:hypothetical protein
MPDEAQLYPAIITEMAKRRSQFRNVRYIDEFNQMWHEDNEDNDADQYLADMTTNVSWRMHQPLRPMYRPMGMPYGALPGPHRCDGTGCRPALRRENARLDAPHVYEFSASVPIRPALVSRFSWDSDDLTERTQSPTAALAQTGKSLLKRLTPNFERLSMEFSKKRI